MQIWASRGPHPNFWAYVDLWTYFSLKKKRPPLPPIA